MTKGPPEGLNAHSRQAGRHARRPSGNGAEKADAGAAGSCQSCCRPAWESTLAQGRRSARPEILGIWPTDVDTSF